MEQKSDNLQVFQDQSKLTFKKRKSIRKRRRTFNIRNTLKPKKNLKVIQYGKIIDEKLCQNCKNNDHDDKFIFCDQCDDAYHKFCLDPPLINLPQGIWLCPKCQILQNEMKNDKLKNQQSQEPQNCSKCSQPLKNHKILKYQNQKGIQMQQTIPSQKVKCLYCKNWFHDSCMSKRLNSLNCYSCEIFLRRSCPKNHLQFVNFIKKQNQLVIKSGYLKLYDQLISQQQEDPQKSKKKQRKQVNYTFNLKDFDEPTHWQSITRYEASLYYALKTKKLVFCDQQLYKTQSLLAKNNQQKQILKIKPLNQSDTRTYQFFKWKISKGAVGPYQIKQDRIKGFYVQATAPIQKGTIICQYAGEVCSHRESLKQVKNDSIFTLLTSGSSEDDLNIIPNKFGNMSRFICGINNNDRQQMRLINLKAIRFSYKGRIRILFCAKKYIQKGETLYLNYNDGTFQEYPTENFVA